MVVIVCFEESDRLALHDSQWKQIGIHRMRRTRKNGKYDRRTRKKASRKISDEDQFALYDRDDVIEYLQTGGGGVTKQATTGPKGSRTHARSLMAHLVEIGWDPAFVTTAFRTLDDTLLLEYPSRLFIEDYFKALIRRPNVHLPIKESLMRIGLRSEVAYALEPLLEPLQGSSYTDNQILDTAIYYLLNRYVPITEPHTSHLLRPDTVDEWFSHIPNVSVFNMSQPCSSKAVSSIEEALSFLPDTPTHKYFFHTTSWKGSLSIMEFLDRSQGRRCLDFGIYPGFYMSETVLDCLVWGAKKNRLWSNETAIMIFSVPKILPAQLSYKELRGEEWSSITRQSRECKERQELRTIRSFDLLYGDMVRNPTAVEQGVESPLTHRPPKKQFVSKTDTGDAFIHTCLIGCIYFRKQTN